MCTYVNKRQNQEQKRKRIRKKGNIEIRDRMDTTTEIIMQIRQIKRRI